MYDNYQGRKYSQIPYRCGINGDPNRDEMFIYLFLFFSKSITGNLSQYHLSIKIGKTLEDDLVI